MDEYSEDLFREPGNEVGAGKGKRWNMVREAPLSSLIRGKTAAQRQR
jgi:hypothetical protein